MGSGWWPPPGSFYTPDPGPAPGQRVQDELLEELSVLLPQMSALQDRVSEITRLLLERHLRTEESK